MGAGFLLWLFQSQMLTALDLVCRELTWLDLAFLLVSAPILASYFWENPRITRKIFLQNTRDSETGNCDKAYDIFFQITIRKQENIFFNTLP